MLPPLQVIDEVVSDIILMRLIRFLGGMIRFGLPVVARILPECGMLIVMSTQDSPPW